MLVASALALGGCSALPAPGSPPQDIDAFVASIPELGDVSLLGPGGVDWPGEGPVDAYVDVSSVDDARLFEIVDATGAFLFDQHGGSTDWASLNLELPEAELTVTDRRGVNDEITALFLKLRDATGVADFGVGRSVWARAEDAERVPSLFKQIYLELDGLGATTVGSDGVDVWAGDDAEQEVYGSSLATAPGDALSALQRMMNSVDVLGYYASRSQLTVCVAAGDVGAAQRVVDHEPASGVEIVVAPVAAGSSS